MSDMIRPTLTRYPKSRRWSAWGVYFFILSAFGAALVIIQAVDLFGLMPDVRALMEAIHD
jgi:hypothetical protein